MTRIIAGSARGRQMKVPTGRSTRPTADRVREGLFSTLEALAGPLAGRRFLDLYAGSGGVGLEALSRGAAHACLVEASATAARTVRTNADVLDLPRAQVLAARVEKVLAQPADAPGYDVVFADPPYELTDEELRAVISAAIANGWLAADGIVVVERPTRAGAWRWPRGIAADRSRRYGAATLWYGRAAGWSSVDPPDAEEPAEERAGHDSEE